MARSVDVAAARAVSDRTLKRALNALRCLRILSPATNGLVTPHTARPRTLLALATLSLALLPAATAAAADPLGSWQKVGTHAPHLAAADAPLADGSIVVAGGTTIDGETTTAERFDPATNAWTTLAPMSTPRADAVAAPLSGGRVLVVGGGEYGASRATAEAYDPATGTWTPTGALAAGRRHSAAVALADGRVLVVGGEQLYDEAEGAEIYDPATGTWDLTGPVRATRSGAAATRLADGRVLVAGGYGAGTAAEIYDPATNAWSDAGSLGEPRNGAASVLLPDGRVLIAGGHGWPTVPDASRTAEIYDPAKNTWTATGSLQTPRGEGFSLETLADGRAIAIGGYWWTRIDQGPPLSWSGSRYESNTEIYDPAIGAWSAGATMSSGRAGHVSASLPDGDVLVSGGYGASPIGAERFIAPVHHTPVNPEKPATQPAAVPARPSVVPSPPLKAKPGAAGFGRSLGRRLSVGRDGAVRVAVTCSTVGPCRDEVVLRTRGRKPRTLGRARLTLAAGKSGTARVKLSKAVRRRLAGRSTAVRVTLAGRKVGHNATLRG